MVKETTVCVCSEFPPPYGGIGVQASLLSDCLERDGYKVKRIDSNLPQGIFTMLAGKIRGVRGLLRSFLFTYRCVVLFRKVDIVHILSGSFLNFFLYTTPAVAVAKLLRKPTIIHYHGGAAETFLVRHFFWAKFVFRMADTVIVPSGFLAQIFAKYTIHTKIVPNIIVLKDFCFEKRQELKPHLLITRHLEPEYNILCALKAFDLVWNHFPRALLTIAGSGSDEKQLKAFTNTLKCRGAVTFRGRVDHDEIAKLYQTHDILLNTSNVDNQPLSIIEAMASGLVVASTKAGGIPFMIEHKKTGLLVELDDHEALAEEIQWLLSHQKEALEIISKAYTSIRVYTWTNISREILSVYKNILL